MVFSASPLVVSQYLLFENGFVAPSSFREFWVNMCKYTQISWISSIWNGLFRFPIGCLTISSIWKRFITPSCFENCGWICVNVHKCMNIFYLRWSFPLPHWFFCTIFYLKMVRHTIVFWEFWVHMGKKSQIITNIMNIFYLKWFFPLPPWLFHNIFYLKMVLSHHRVFENSG